MYPLSDKDLDRLSRDAAEHYDVEQNTSGWDNLEGRLNKELPVQKEKERKRFLWFLLLLVMITGGGLFVMLQKNASPEIATIQTKPGEQATPSNSKNQNSTGTKEQKPESLVQNQAKANPDKQDIGVVVDKNSTKDPPEKINKQVNRSSNKLTVQK